MQCGRIVFHYIILDDSIISLPPLFSYILAQFDYFICVSLCVVFILLGGGVGREGGRGRGMGKGGETEGEGSGGGDRGGGREGEAGREREVGREERREGRVREGEGAREHKGVNVGHNTRRTCGLWDTHIQQYIITSSSHMTCSTHLYCIAASHCRKRAKLICRACQAHL